MRYCNANAGGGPGGGTGADVGVVSDSSGLGDAAATTCDGEGALIGGGSMDEFEMGALDGIIGSGNAGISSSVDDVSIVICFVATGAVEDRNE